MKQVWQAEDGTLFPTEAECDSYEYKKDNEQRLLKIVQDFPRIYEATELLEFIADLTYTGHGTLLINYIKSIGDNNGN